LQFFEVFFAQGRVAMTVVGGLDDTSGVELTSTAAVIASVDVYPIESIWVTPDSVRAQPRIYKSSV
jgi:hypothetical protein